MLWNYIARPILFSFPAETAHELAMSCYSAVAKIPLADRVIRSVFQYNDERLAIARFGINFKNCIGLAAGFDKNARWFNELSYLGFGHIEVGTLTGQPQPGNDKPRLFRIAKDRGLINRMGFNNLGSPTVAENLARFKTKCVLGINIGKTKVVEIENAVDDYLASFRRLFAYADYFTVNVSSPNTPNLRQLQDREPLQKLLGAVQRENALVALQQNVPAKPILLKIAPDLDESALEEIASIAIETGTAGIIATNTTTSRAGLQTATRRLMQIGVGGISGGPLTNVSRRIVSKLFRAVEGRLPIIGVGGIMQPDDAWKMICSGASLIQLYTGFVYGGPFFARSVLKHLSKKLDEHDLNSIEIAVGRDLN